MDEKDRAGTLPSESVLQLREELASMESRGALPPKLRALKARLDDRLEEEAALMEILLLGIYSFFVWLIFIKLKWLPWNIAAQVIVVIIPIVGLSATILLLNIFAPSSSDVRVYTYTVPIVSQVRGRVIEVPVEEGNRLVKK